MMRTPLTVLILAGLSFLSPRPAAAAQPAAQTSLNPVPRTHFYAAGRSYLGVDIRDITPDRVASLKLKDEQGVEVTMVDQDAPAGKAGLREHDVILDFNGTAVQSEEQLRRLIRETPPGRTVALGISRDGNPMKINVELADYGKLMGKNRIVIPPIPRIEIPDFGNRFDVPGNVYVLRNTSAVMGVQTENLTSQLGEFFGVKNGEGVLVRSVEKGSPAEKGGLKAGDVIIRIGDEKLSDRSDFSRIMRKYRAGGKLNLGVIRDKHEQTFSVDLPPRSEKESSLDYFDPEEMRALFDDLKPEFDSIAQSAREMAKLNTGELEKAMRQYKDQFSKQFSDQFSRQFSEQFKDLQKQLEKQQQEFNRDFHPML
jgi:serine protease Do